MNRKQLKSVNKQLRSLKHMIEQRRYRLKRLYKDDGAIADIMAMGDDVRDRRALLEKRGRTIYASFKIPPSEHSAFIFRDSRSDAEIMRDLRTRYN